MTDPTIGSACERYFEDPEANAAHLQTCAECRGLNAALAVKTEVEPKPIDVNSLPLAAWEGSSHRPWGLILGGAAIVVAIALALLDATGTSPVHVAQSSLASMESFRALLNSATAWLRTTSIGWQIVFGAAFLVVNGLLIVLLRRAPRGIDA